MGDVGYRGCPGISHEGFGHVGLGTLLWHISQDVMGYKDSPWHSWTFMITSRRSIFSEIHELKIEISSFLSHWYLALSLQTNKSADIARTDRRTD